MQMLCTVELQNKLLHRKDLEEALRVVKEVPVASKDNLGESLLIQEAVLVDVIVDDEVVGQDRLLAGRVYKSSEFYYTQPATGIKVKAYHWEATSADEIGKLGEFELPLTIDDSKMVGDNKRIVRLNWAEPKDYVNDVKPTTNAIWLYTAIVRKQGDRYPTSLNDGEIVGYSSARNQYMSGTGFVDIIPATRDYKYNVFAVTRGGVATASEEQAIKVMDWNLLQQRIQEGRAGEVLALGDTIVVNHKFLGDIEFQVVAFDNATLVDASKTHSVTLMTRNALFRSAYDVPERHDAVVGDEVQVNPNDDIVGEDSNYWASTRGCAVWSISNLRRWLNNGDAYKATTDTKYNTRKFYFTYDPVKDTYTQVIDPIDPTRVNPAANGYFEFVHSWKEVTPIHDWEVMPDPDKTDAGYAIGNKILPGFLHGFVNGTEDKKEFIDIVATVKNNTYNSAAVVEHTQDKFWIPSYKEIYGETAPGQSGGTGEYSEGSWFPFFNPEVFIPGLEERTLLRRDMHGILAGFYLRTMETILPDGADRWRYYGRSGLWTVKSRGFTSVTKPPITNKDTAETYSAKMSKTDSNYHEIITIDNVDYLCYPAPAVAVCVTIA